MKLLLASSSPYRRQLLARLRLPFECCSPDIDESILPDERPENLVIRLAEEKARTAAHKFTGGLIIGSDQVASLFGDILTKPGNFTKARQQLTACSGHTVTFYTGLCLYNTASKRSRLHIDTYSVRFRKLSEQEITHYLECEQPYDCAGSFKAEGLGIALFESMQGKDPNSLTGLPLISLVNLLKKEGINVLDSKQADCPSE